MKSKQTVHSSVNSKTTIDWAWIYRVYANVNTCTAGRARTTQTQANSSRDIQGKRDSQRPPQNAKNINNAFPTDDSWLRVDV